MNRYVYLLISFIWHSSVKSLVFITEDIIDDGHWTFQEGSTVKLVCTHDPYTGIHTFTLDSTRVLSCTASVCLSNNSFQKAFSFEYDTDSGIFTWIINNVNMTYNDKVFECYDGLTYIRNTVKVNMVKGGSSENPPGVVIALSCVVAVCFIIICLIIIYIRIILVIVRTGVNAAGENESRTSLLG